MNNVHRVKTISEFHRTRGLSEPEHPLISVVNYEDIKLMAEYKNDSWVFDFYSISLKRNLNGKIIYGQKEYDFDEGVMFFISPGQVFSIELNPDLSPGKSGWIMLVHPDFLWKTTLAKDIKQYEYFGYAVNEALFLSKKEEHTIAAIIENIQQEYHSNIDKFSQQIIISQLLSILNYAERFYQRQFITRRIDNHQILTRLEQFLDSYFQNDDLTSKGIPTVQYVSDSLNISPSYLSSVLKLHTGKSTLEHIHEKLIELAKENLSTTNLSISEIAYKLGFDYPQSFSKLFKNKSGMSPVEFRASFNP